ncbi:MAG: hypothetical protein ACJAUD_001731 [Crocinitomicaceae bacterium]|jgi:hypothetical protein
MSEEVFRWISYFGIVFDFFPLIMLLIINKKVHREMRWALFFVIISWIISDCLSSILGTYGINNFIVYNIFSIVSTCLYLLLFYYLDKRKIFGLTLLGIGFAYVFFSVSFISLNESWFLPVPIIDIFTGIIPLVLSLLFFYNLFKSLRVPNLLEYPFYCINTAIMMHFGMTFFIYIFLEVIYLNNQTAMYLWLIVIISNIIYNILFTLGLWLMKRT